jgi:hypothetical protein
MLSAVLNSGIEGARRVLARNGALVAPSSVVAERDEVREDSNPLGELIEAGWIVRDAEATAASSDLRRAMEIWADRRGYRPTWAPRHKKLADLLLRGGTPASRARCCGRRCDEGLGVSPPEQAGGFRPNGIAGAPH